jgi:hypothetical protein
MKKNYIVLGRYVVFDDDTGTEIVRRRQRIREDISIVAERLRPHNIFIKNVKEETFWDHRVYGQSHGVALEFETKEDLVMATILIQDLIDQIQKNSALV